jgi:hypothetical protein
MVDFIDGFLRRGNRFFFGIIFTQEITFVLVHVVGIVVHIDCKLHYHNKRWSDGMRKISRSFFRYSLVGYMNCISIARASCYFKGSNHFPNNCRKVAACS